MSHHDQDDKSSLEPGQSGSISRRDLLISAGGAIGASFLPSTLVAQDDNATATTTVFAHTTVVTNDINRRTLRDVALAVRNGVIAAIGETNEVLEQFPQAEVYDGRRKALLPGLINCHAHLAATIAKGFNEDYGFPNSLNLEESPASLLSSDEATVMSTLAAVEGLRAGTTTMVQNVGGIARDAESLARTGQRWVFAESIRDITTVDGPMSPPRLAASVPPEFSAQLREEGMQRISDLFETWHGRNDGLVSVFPAAALVELCSPELLRDVHEFADQHELGYTIHMTQSQAEVEFMLRYHGVRPAIFLEQHDFLGPRLFAAHARYCDDTEIAALGQSKTIITHQAAMAANRGVNPPISALREAGCTIALGTDNNHTDMLHVMKTAISLERIQRQDDFPGMLPQPGGHARRCLQRRRSRRQPVIQHRLPGSRQESRLARSGYVQAPLVTIGPHSLRLDPQRPAVGHRVCHGGRQVRHAGSPCSDGRRRGPHGGGLPYR